MPEGPGQTVHFSLAMQDLLDEWNKYDRSSQREKQSERELGIQTGLAIAMAVLAQHAREAGE